MKNISENQDICPRIDVDVTNGKFLHPPLRDQIIFQNGVP